MKRPPDSLATPANLTSSLRRRLSAIAATATLVVTAQAQFLVEPFDHADAAGTQLSTIAGWTSGAGATAVTLQDGNLIGGGLTELSVANNKKVRMTAVNSIHFCSFNGSAVGSGSVYVSFLLQATAVQTTDNYYSALLCLDNDGSISTSSGTGARQARAGLVVYYQRTSATTYRIGVRKNEGSATAGTITWGSASFGTSETVLVVGKYTFNPSSGDDTVTLWLNPTTLGGAEDASPAVAATTSGNTTDSAPLQQLVLVNGSGGNGGGTVEIDNIRVGDSWSVVTPSGPLVGQKLGFVVNPTVAYEGTALNPVVVQIQNASGLPVPSNNVPVTLTLTSGSGTLSGTLAQNTDANGRASFTGLSVNLAGQKQLTAAASGIGAGLTNGVSSPFWIVKDFNAGVVTSPVITQTLATAGNIILRGNNGSPNGEYQVLAATNVALAVNQWSAIATNNFDVNGAFNWTNAIPPGTPHRFYRLASEGVASAAADPAGFSGPITGGGNTTNIIVATNLAGLMAVATNVEPWVIYVAGTITLRTNGNTYLGPNKTIIGLGTNATLIGCLGIFFTEGSTTYGATNIIIRNLNIKNPNGYGEDDGITIKNGGSHVWVDHCTISDCLDGLVDATREADYITVSWCKFFYTAPNGHENVNLIGGSDDDSSDAGKLRVTLHHNWYGDLAKERMPSVRYGKAHVYNNYFNAVGNNYCTRTRLNAEILAENNYYDGVQNPFELIITSGTTGLIRTVGNITNNCTFNTAYAHNTGGTLILPDGTDTVFTPDYTYALDAAANVPGIVTNNVGVGKGPFAP